MKKTNQIVKYIKGRVSTLSVHIEYYEDLEGRVGYLTTDQKASYNIALAQFRELERLVDFIESTDSERPGA